jgi:hypothetical protein
MGTALTVTSQQSIETMARSWARFHSANRCPRCSGLMVSEWYQDLSDYTAQRCVQCGEIVDPVILQNRRQCGMTIDQTRNESTHRLNVVTGKQSG